MEKRIIVFAFFYCKWTLENFFFSFAKIFNLRRRGHAQSKASQQPTTLEPGSYSKGQYTHETVIPSEGELFEMIENMIERKVMNSDWYDKND